MDADILVAPHSYGGICVFELSIETAASPVLISAANLYQPKNQRIELAFNLKDSALRDFRLSKFPLNFEFAAMAERHFSARSNQH